MTDDEVAALGSDGWFVREGFAPAAGAAAQVAADRHGFEPAGVSRARHHDPRVRGDRQRWVGAEEIGYAPLFAGFEALRAEVNAGAWLGLVRFDVQLAHYPGGGARYARHRDALRGAPNRRLTAISYLNADWAPADGGELRLHTAPCVDLAPQLGRLVVFLSDRVEHEVLPTFADRYAATAWYYG